jgi:hypothetical protein
MKKYLLILVAITAFAPVAGFAQSSQYVCTAPTPVTPADVAAALNSLSCDTTKPFTVSTYSETGFTIVCCVQQ